MNQQPEESGDNSTYSSQSGGQTNPFTADLKGEFTSNFGTSTNAVSQIFKEGQFSQGKSKVFVGGGLAVLLLLVGYIFLFDDAGMDDEFMGGDVGQQTSQLEDSDQLGDDADLNATGDDAFADDNSANSANSERSMDSDELSVADEDAGLNSGEDSMGRADAMVQSEANTASMDPASDAPILRGPADGATRRYDETSGAAEFSWDGSPGGYVVLSRSRSMTPQVMKIRVRGNTYMFNHPWPGTWYWRVDNGAGSSEVRSFRIPGITRRNIQVAEPQSGGAISGNGGIVSWTGDSKVAHYRVELTSGGWGNPQHRFATSGTQTQLQGVQPGQYQMRVGAFSEVAGRWEFTQPISVTVQ